MSELEQIKTDIDLVEYAENFGYTIDPIKTSRACIVMKGNDRKIGISTSIDGHWVYYDFNTQSGGSILDFIMTEMNFNLGQARKELRPLLGTTNLSNTKRYIKPSKATPNRHLAAIDFARTSLINKNVPFLQSRQIFINTINSYRFKEMIRVDKNNNACFPYTDNKGVCCIERRNFNYKSFTKGGERGLWRSRLFSNDQSIVICESPIDAISYQILHQKVDCQYYCTGGLISKKQWKLFDQLFKDNLGKDTVLAFDNDNAGMGYISRIKKRYPNNKFIISIPEDIGHDWNDVLISMRLHNTQQ